MRVSTPVFSWADCDARYGPWPSGEEPRAWFRRWSAAISWIAVLAPLVLVCGSSVASYLSLEIEGPIRARTLFAILLAGISLRGWHAGGSPRVSAALAGILATTGLLTLTGHLGAAGDAVREALYRSGRLVSPGRSSLPASAIVTLMGASLWSLHRKWPARWTEGLSLAGFTLSLTAVIGHLYHADELFAPLSRRGIEMTPSLILALVCFGILIARPHEGVMALVTSDRAAGRIARGVLPAIVLVPIICGSLSLTGSQRGLYDHQLAMALVVVATIVVLGLLVLVHAAALLRQDQRLEEVRAKLVEMHRIDAASYLAGWICHEVNNLLTVILGNANLILQEEVSPTVRDCAIEVDAAAREWSDLSRKLLQFSSHEVATASEVDLSSVIASMTPTLDSIVGPAIRIDLALEEGCFVRVSRPLLEHVIVQLVLNARDAMPRGGQLVVTVSRVDAPPFPVRLQVVDSGTGMSDDVRARAIEPFFTTKPRGRGTGLGLACVFGILKQHDAQLNIDSTPGHGTTVNVSFPASTRSSTPTA